MLVLYLPRPINDLADNSVESVIETRCRPRRRQKMPPEPRPFFGRRGGGGACWFLVRWIVVGLRGIAARRVDDEESVIEIRSSLSTGTTSPMPSMQEQRDHSWVVVGLGEVDVLFALVLLIVVLGPRMLGLVGLFFRLINCMPPATPPPKRNKNPGGEELPKNVLVSLLETILAEYDEETEGSTTRSFKKVCDSATTDDNCTPIFGTPGSELRRGTLLHDSAAVAASRSSSFLIGYRLPSFFLVYFLCQLFSTSVGIFSDGSRISRPTASKSTNETLPLQTSVDS